MADPTTEFFAELERRGHEQLLEKVKATIRFDIVQGKKTGRWLVTIDRGDITVSRRNASADSTVRVERPLFDELVTGHANATAEVLRGRLAISGEIEPVDPAPARLSRPAARGGEAMSDEIKILDGNTFVVSDGAGDIEASATDPTGLFSFDTRFLSQWVLTINGERLTALSTDDLQYFETRFFLIPGASAVYQNSKQSVIRTRSVVDGFHERITVLNHDDKPVDLTVRIDAANDFADLFEVKDALAKKGMYGTQVKGKSLVLGYRRETYARATVITASGPAKFDRKGLSFKVRVRPQGEWSTDVQVSIPLLDAVGRDPRRAKRSLSVGLDRWLGAAPRLECDWEPLRHTYQRSLVDLAALRFSPLTAGRSSLPAAGLPWFMTMFGRDSIFTSLQALPFTPELAATTLRELGSRQGTRIDDFRDEDPGRILHEMRYGELTAFEERPHSPYYGSADATPLYVVLLDEYERWTGDRKLVRDFEVEARAALRWIDEYADLQGNGYIAYQRRNEETGLENQCWKDSWDSLSYRDGRLPGFPRATCELQGYAYDAKVRGARLAREIWKDSEDTPTSSRSRPRTSSVGSTETSGLRTAGTSPWLWTPTARRSTPSPRTTAICCGAGSWTSRRRSRS